MKLRNDTIAADSKERWMISQLEPCSFTLDEGPAYWFLGGLCT